MCLRIVTALLLVPALIAGPLASVASAVCGAGRPACTILRPAPTGSMRMPPADAPECVVLVGGLGSPPNDAFFDPLVAGASSGDGRPLRAIRFGYDDALDHPYDTYGAIDRSASSLRSLIRELGDECYAIDVVAHSMGGVVADRAFSMGLTSADGVVTYLPLSSPHNGAFAARALRLGVELDDTFAQLESLITRRLGWADPTREAVRDLARRVSPRPPRGVEEVRQRLVTDLTVLRRDNADRRYDVREYLPTGVDQLEGHSGIVKNQLVQAVVARAIRDHAVPPETRSALEEESAGFASRLVERYWGGLIAAGGLALGATALGTAVGTSVTERNAAAVLEAGRELVERLPDEVELIEAARQLREPPGPAVIQVLIETVLGG